jgi:hypothetical protein
MSPRVHFPAIGPRCVAIIAILVLASPGEVRAQPKAAEKAVNNKGGGSPAANVDATPGAGGGGNGKSVPAGTENARGPNDNASDNAKGVGAAADGKAIAAVAENARGPNENASGNAKGAAAGDAKAVAAVTEKAKGPNENASDNAKAIHVALEKFKAERTRLLDERAAVLEKLKGASDAEKKAILEQLRVESKAREEEERALAKQVREELKKIREDRKVGSE